MRNQVRRPFDSNGIMKLLPAFMLVFGLVTNLATPPDVTLTPIYAAAPLVAAPLLGFRATLLTSAATVVGVALLTLARHIREDEQYLEIVTVLTVALIAVGINLVLGQREQQLATAQGLADAIQRAVVPEPPAEVGSLSVATRYRASYRDRRVGGDLYSVVETPYGIRLILGDVRGKGLQATESVAVVLGAFREAADAEPDLPAVAARLERSLARAARQSENLDEEENFVTAVLAETEVEADGEADPPSLRFLNRGHPPPLLLNRDGQVTPLYSAESGLPLGLEMDTGRSPPVHTLQLPRGAMLLLYTDGVTDARDTSGNFYNPLTRLRKASFFSSPADLLDWLTADLTGFAGELQDDVALLAVRRKELPGEEPVGRRGVGSGAAPYRPRRPDSQS